MRFAERASASLRQSQQFLARYPGRCPSCDERIVAEEDFVRYDGDDLVHAGCHADRPPVRTTPVCRTCFVTRPCFCEAA